MTPKFDVEKVFNAEEYLYFYQNILTPEKLKSEIDFLVKYTQLDRSLKILDLACGHGRHANVLAALGHEVTGIDITKEFLTIAKKESKRQGVDVKYLQDDMRNLKYKNSFDRINVMFTAIGYFDDGDNEKVFENIFKALKPGGIFCFDSHNRDAFMTYMLPYSVVEREGNLLVDKNEFDTLTGHCKTKRTIVMNNKTKSFEYFVRFYNPTELSSLFKKIGFSSVSFYEPWEGKPLNSRSKRMVVIAQK